MVVAAVVAVIVNCLLLSLSLPPSLSLLWSLLIAVITYNRCRCDNCCRLFVVVAVVLVVVVVVVLQVYQQQPLITAKPYICLNSR